MPLANEFTGGEFLPGDPDQIIDGLPKPQKFKATALYLELHKLFEIPIYANPIYNVEEKKNCPPSFIELEDGLQDIGRQNWLSTFMDQPAVKVLVWECVTEREILPVSQPINQIQNEADVAALYSYLEGWAVGLLRYLKFPATGSREVRREQGIDGQPKAPADNDLGLRLDATMSWSHNLFRNWAWFGIEFKFPGMNAARNWVWTPKEALHLQSQLKQYAKTLRIRIMHCFDGYNWTIIVFSKNNYDAPAKVFRGNLYHGVLALVTSYLACWIEKEFESTTIRDARRLAQGVLYSETGPLLVLWQEDGWYMARTGVRVAQQMQLLVKKWNES